MLLSEFRGMNIFDGEVVTVEVFDTEEVLLVSACEVVAVFVVVVVDQVLVDCNFPLSSSLLFLLFAELLILLEREELFLLLLVGGEEEEVLLLFVTLEEETSVFFVASSLLGEVESVSSSTGTKINIGEILFYFRGKGTVC